MGILRIANKKSYGVKSVDRIPPTKPRDQVLPFDEKARPHQPLLFILPVGLTLMYSEPKNVGHVATAPLLDLRPNIFKVIFCAKIAGI